MSRCPPRSCSGCRDKAWEERIAQKAEIWWTKAVSNGPVPELHTDSEEEEPKEADKPIKLGECIFTIGLVPSPAEIRATSSVSQCLAKAFICNSKASVPLDGLFWSIWRSLTASFPRSLLMLYQSPKNWTMQLSWSLERRPLTARFICWLQRSKRSLTNSLRKTWKQVRSICLSLQWHLQSFSLRRRMVLYSLFRTIGP